MATQLAVPIPSYDDGEHDLGLAEQIRRDLARELHDSVAQTLTVLLVAMEDFKREQAGMQSVVDSVDFFQAATREVLSELRSVLYRLRDESHDTSEFTGELRQFLARFEAASGISCRLRVARDWPQRLSKQRALHLLRIVGEAMTNARRHAGTDRIDVSLGTSGPDLVVAVRDRGRGLPFMGVKPGHGLRSIQERVLLLGGRMRVESAEGAGTSFRITIPNEETS